MPPGIHGGNFDNKELIAGTSVFLPIHVRGALVSIGDGHAAQGDGEVDGTGLETDLSGEFRFIVWKNRHLRWPRAETPTHRIIMGFDRDLATALKAATSLTIDVLVEEYSISREEAYMLASVAVDFRITQVVDGVQGVHAMIPKTLVKK